MDTLLRLYITEPSVISKKVPLNMTIAMVKKTAIQVAESSVRATEAMTSPRALAAAAKIKAITRDSRSEELEDNVGQDQQNERLHEAAGNTGQKLAYEKLPHAEPGGEQPLQGSLLALFHYGPGAQGYGKEDEHGNDTRQELVNWVRAAAYCLLLDLNNGILAFPVQEFLDGNFYALLRNVPSL
jgi:hypothetical protein